MTGENMLKISTAVYNKYFSKYTDIREDLINEGIVGILKSKPFYSVQKGSKSTFFWICAKRSMISYLKKEFRHRRMIAKDEVEEVYEFIPDGNSMVDDPYSASAEIDKLREVVSCYKGKRKQIAEDLLNCKKPKELVNKYGITKQRISQVFIDIKNRSNNIYEYKEGYLVRKENNNGKEI